MVIRFFVLQAHYRSTLDFSNGALQAAQKGLDRLMKGVEALSKIKCSDSSTVNPEELSERCEAAMNDDLNSPMVISALFDWVRVINQLVDGAQSITESDLKRLSEIVNRFVFEVLGSVTRRWRAVCSRRIRDYTTPLVEMLLQMRTDAKTNKDWAMSDKIRDGLNTAGIE